MFSGGVAMLLELDLNFLFWALSEVVMMECLVHFLTNMWSSSFLFVFVSSTNFLCMRGPNLIEMISGNVN